MSPRKGKITKQQVLDAVREVAEREGRTPSSAEWTERRLSPAYGTIRRLFPSWRAMVHEAGLQPRISPGAAPQLTEEQLCEVMERIRAGENIVKVAYDYRVKVGTIYRRVGIYLDEHPGVPSPFAAAGPYSRATDLEAEQIKGDA